MSIYGLIIGIAFVIGLEYFQKKEKLLSKKDKIKYQISIFLLSILGARTYFVLFNLDYYKNNLNEIINTRAGGMGIFGGLIFSIIFTFIFLKSKKINFLNFTDQFVAILPLCQSIGRWGNYFNHEIYSETGQPIWLYESILNFILFLILVKSKNHQTAKYLIGYGAIRFITELFRYDVWIINNIKIGQIISIIFILIGIFLIKKNTDIKIKQKSA